MPPEAGKNEAEQPAASCFGCSGGAGGTRQRRENFRPETAFAASGLIKKEFIAIQRWWRQKPE